MNATGELDYVKRCLLAVINDKELDPVTLRRIRGLAMTHGCRSHDVRQMLKDLTEPLTMEAVTERLRP